MNGPRCAGLGLLCAAALAAVLAAPAHGASQKPRVASAGARALAVRMLEQLNIVRSQHHLSRLRSSPGLRAAAAGHSEDMASAGYFAHESADGSPFWKRVQRLYPATGFRSWDVGETLLWSSPDVNAPGAIADWLASPPHRAILLTPKWREVGIAAVHALDAPGVYDGLEVTIVTADFGVRVH